MVLGVLFENKSMYNQDELFDHAAKYHYRKRLRPSVFSLAKDEHVRWVRLGNDATCHESQL